MSGGSVGAKYRRDLPNDEFLAAINAASASASNPFATINDLAAQNEWSEVLSNGATSGGTDPILTSGDVMKSSAGGGQLDLRAGADNTVVLSTDNGAFAGGYLYMDGAETYLQSVSGGSVLTLTSTLAGFSIGTTSYFMDQAAGTFRMKHTAMPELIFDSTATLFDDGTLVPLVLTAARTWNLPDKSGTIALLDDLDGAGIYGPSDSLTVDHTTTLGSHDWNIDVLPVGGANGKLRIGTVGATSPHPISIHAPSGNPIAIYGVNGSSLTSALRIYSSGGTIIAADFYNDGDSAFGVTGAAPGSAATGRGRVSIGINQPIVDAKLTVKAIDNTAGRVILHLIDASNNVAVQVQNDRRFGIVAMGATTVRANIRALAADVDILNLQNDLGQDQFTFRRDGLMQIDTAATQVSGIEMYSIASEKSTSANEIHGSAGFVHRFNPTVNGTGRTTAVYGNAIKEGAFNSTESQGGFFQSSNTGTGNITNNRGLVAQAINSGNATITRQYALETNTQTTGTGTITDFGGIRVRREQAALGATITNFYGIKIDTPTNTGATVTNTFGIQIDPCTIGSTNYGIQQLGPTMINRFDGNTAFGVASPGTSKLLVHGAGTGTGTMVTFENDSALDKWVWRDNGQVYTHAGGTATPQATMGQYHQSTNFNFGFAIYGRTGTAVSLFTVNASNNAGAKVIDAQFQGNPTGEATSIRGLSWQTSSTTNIGVQGSARNGASYNVGVEGLIPGGGGVIPAQYCAAVRGNATYNLDAEMYGGHFRASTNNAGTTFTKDIVGVYGSANPQSGTANTSDAYGAIFEATGTGGTGNRYGIKASAINGTRDNIAIWVPNASGDVVIGAATKSVNNSIVEITGDLEILGSANGLILESPDTTRYRVTMLNGGTLDVNAA